MRASAFVLGAIVVLAASMARAGEAGKKASPPPLPLHTIEGTTGVFLTDTAYFANMPEGDGWLGKPSVAISGVKAGHKHLQAYSVTTNIFKRIELGYSYIHFGLGDWPEDVRAATTLHPNTSVVMHTFNTRAMVITEGDFGLAWMPAITAGVRYKHNDDIWGIDDDLAGTCRAIGVKDNDGWEATLTASKTFAGILPRPFILSAGLRSTEAAQNGLLGFSGDRDVVFEGSAVFFVTDRLLLAGEYRQKPDNLRRAGTLVGAEHDWWDVALAYIVSDQLTVSAAYAHLGNVLNHEENASYTVQLKWEF